MRRLLAIVVDGIITDRPDVLVWVLEMTKQNRRRRGPIVESRSNRVVPEQEVHAP